jgi:antitoxin (DNA-binding transcriptional repressor) of toxin-antitoxin stability system
MKTVSATEAKQGLSSVIEWAANEPVVIRRQKRDVAVVLSMREYERLARLNLKAFQAFSQKIGDRAEDAGLNEATLAEILNDD